MPTVTVIKENGTKENNMNIKSYMVLAVAALTAACAASSEAPSVAEAAGPAAEEALATANAEAPAEAVEPLDANEKPKADSK